MSRALLQQSVYRMVADGEPLVGGNTGGFGIRFVAVSETWRIRRLRMTKRSYTAAYIN